MTQAEVMSCNVSISQGTPRIISKWQEPGKRPGQSLPHGPLKGLARWTPWSWTSSLQVSGTHQSVVLCCGPEDANTVSVHPPALDHNVQRVGGHLISTPPHTKDGRGEAPGPGMKGAEGSQASWMGGTVNMPALQMRKLRYGKAERGGQQLEVPRSEPGQDGWGTHS
jgi:hypothetical protein